MKKRKLLAGLFVATAALGLAACTDTETPVEPEPTPEVTKYTVTFNVNGGSAVASIKVDANGKITLPANPTKADNTFGGWFTDSACTKAFDANTAITANITLYAKWTPVEKDPDADKVKIADAEDFIAMLKGEFEEVAVGSGLVEHYILTADIDFADIDLGAELGQTAYSFSGILDGRGYTISNLKLIRQKKQVGLFEGVFAGTIKNLNFKDVEVSNAPVDAEGNALTDDCRGVSLFGNYAAGGASFENIAIDGFKVYTNADSTKVEESAGFVVNCFDTVYLENIAITGMDVTMGKNSGAVLGAMRVTTDTLKVAGVEVADKTACVIEAKNILLEGNINGTTSDSQGLGGLIGRCDNTEDGQSINVDGFVFKGTITGTKNNGPLVGNVKQTGTVVNVKNAYALAGGIASDGTLQGTANVFAGQFKSEDYTFENCFYVDRLYNTKKEKDGKISTLGYLDPEIAAPIKASEITAITDAFTVADGKITLNGLSVELPTDVTVADTAASTVTVNGATPTITDGVITITGEIPYWHAASAAGAAGNFVEVKLVAAEGVTTTDSFYVLGTTCSYENAAEMSIYVPVAPLAEGVNSYPDANIQVRWNNAAKDEVYTIKFAEGVTLEAAPVHGTISQDIAGLTAANPVVDNVTNNFALEYTAGEIAWDNDANYAVVKVAQPTWAEGLNTPIINNATLVSCADGVATIKVKVTSNGANFTVQWSATTDAQAYAITLNGATLAARPEGGTVVTTNYSLDLTEFDAAADKATIASFEKNSFLTVVDSSKVTARTKNGACYAIENKDDNLTVTFNGTGTLTVEFASTSGSNISAFGVKDSTGAWLTGAEGTTATVIAAGVQGGKDGELKNYKEAEYGAYTVVGSTYVKVVYNIEVAGTYTLASPSTTNGRGCRINVITMVDNVVEATTPTVQPIDKSIKCSELAPTTGATDRTHDLAASEIDSFFTIADGTTLQKYCDSNITKVNSIQFDKNEAIIFTVDQKVTVTLQACSTGGSNCSLLSLTDAAGVVQTQTSALPLTTTGLVSLKGSSNLDVTYVLEAGTYTLSFVTGNDDSTNAGGEIGRGGRLASIVVKTYVAA